MDDEQTAVVLVTAACGAAAGCSRGTVNSKSKDLKIKMRPVIVSSPRSCYSGCWMELSAEIATILQMGTQEPRHFYQFIQVNFVQLDQQQAVAAVVLMF